jgi:KaiC/GvpD/RAD55 family RecA-like ATPase
MPQYFKEHGERLVELGYRIVPLPPGSKGPNRKGWPKFELTAESVRKMAANGSAHDGVGVLAATTPAIDVDILDEEVAQQMSDEIDRIFAGQALMTRTGRAPKFLIPFRSDEPFRKLTSKVYSDGKHEHKVEILGDGQQWVAYHIHPGTELPYAWWDGVADDGIVSVALTALPLLSRSDGQRVIDAFELLAAGMVAAGRWAANSTPAVRIREDVARDDPFAGFAEPVSDLTRAQIEALVHKCDSSAYDRWIDVGMMLHHQYAAGEEGFEIWEAWSANAHNYDAEAMRPHWESFGNSSAAPRTIRGLLKEFGQPKSAEPTDADRAFRFYAGDDYATDFNAAPEIVEDVLPDRGIAMVYGPSGKGKTFWTLDLAFHVHNGERWRDKDVACGDVMYVAAEAGRGIKKRIHAVKRLHPEWRAPFVADIAPDLASAVSLEAVRDAALAAGSPRIVIIDTMSASFEGDDSSQQDIAKMMRNLKTLSDALECLVVFVHHTTKDGASYRGSGVLFANVDAVLELVSEGEGAERKQWVTQRKHREGEDGKSYPFSLKVSEPLAFKPNGKPITSCTVEQEDYKPVTKPSKKPRGGEFETSQVYATARHFLSVIQDEIGMGDVGIDEQDVILAIQKDEKDNKSGFEDYPPVSNIKRTLLTLAKQGKIRREGRWIRLC